MAASFSFLLLILFRRVLLLNMCEVLRTEFRSKFAQIADSIERASFIAIDTEFTGLQVNLQDKLSLFDTNEERYDKLKTHAEHFIICQMGVSAFVKEDGENQYNAHTYNFYIRPQSKGVLDANFLWQASSMEFLCQHGFDFNKFASEGLSYLNRDEERELRQQLRERRLFTAIKRDVDDRAVQRCCSEVAVWLSTRSKEGDEMVLHIDECVADYVVHKELRRRFVDVWTVHGKDSEVIVQRVCAEKRHELESSHQQLDDRLLDDFLGYTKVFQLLIASKKPLIGHNLFVDLLLMFNQFYKPLPKTLELFKREILDLFPAIFDTKHMSLTMRKIFDRDGVLESNVLGELYAALDGHRGRFCVLHSPKIIHADGFCRYGDSLMQHEAGFDAFLTGYVFLRLAHMHAMHDLEVEKHRPLPFDRLVSKLEVFRNRLNLIRANLDFLDLEGASPKCTRPKWLVVRSKSGRDISTSEITELCSQFGSVDVKLLDSCVCMAVTNWRSVREINKFLLESQDLQVVAYDPLKHSKWTRALLWSCAAVSTAIGANIVAVMFARF